TSPSRKAAMVPSTPVLANSCSMAGKPGRYMSMETGPSAVIAPTSNGHRGGRRDWVMGPGDTRRSSGAGRSTAVQLLRMVAQVIGDEGGDEIVAMVIAFVPAQFQAAAGAGAG